MNSDPKRKPRSHDVSLDQGERRRGESALDEALENTFPASDPISIAQPAPPADDRDRELKKFSA
jgi:hypothetical protein